MPPPFRRCHSGRVKPFDKSPKSGLMLKGLGLVFSLLLQGQAIAEELDFDIPAQPLSSALKELARQGDLQVLYNPDDVRGKTSGVVRGKLTPEQAVTDLLRKAGVAHTFEANTLTLGRTPLLPPVTLKPVAIQAQQFGVTTEGSGSYTTAAVSLNKTPQSLRDTAIRDGDDPPVDGRQEPDRA